MAEKEKEEKVERVEVVQPENGKPSGGGGMNMMQLLIAVALAALISYGMVSFVGVTKTDFNASMEAISADMQDVQEVNTDQDERIDNAVEPDLSAYATLEDLPDLSIYALLTDIPGVVDLASYVTFEDLLSMADRITALEEALLPPSDGEEPTELVSCLLEPVGSQTTDWDDVEDKTTLTMVVKATVTNNGMQDLEKLEFEVTLSLYSTAGLIEFFRVPGEECSLVGGKIPTWYLLSYGTSPYAPIFTNINPYGWGAGFALDAGETETDYLTLILVYAGDERGSLVFDEPEMECVDYEVAGS